MYMNIRLRLCKFDFWEEIRQSVLKEFTVIKLVSFLKGQSAHQNVPGLSAATVPESAYKFYISRIWEGMYSGLRRDHEIQRGVSAKLKV